MSPTPRAPSGCIDLHPTAQSVYLAGRPINLMAISRAQGIDHSYLSRIFNGQRNPTVAHLQKIAAALGLTMDELVEAIDVRLEQKVLEQTSLVARHRNRVRQESLEDGRTKRQGKPVVPRMPGLR